MAKVIAICNHKGGIGKSTTAICLSQELQLRGYKVLFIDTDGQCNSTSFYLEDNNIEKTIYDIFVEDTPAEECIRHTKYGDIIPSNRKMNDVELAVPFDTKRFTHMRRVCRNINSKYDFVIIDTPPQIGIVIRNVLMYAHYAIIPVDESGWAVSGLMDLQEVIEEVSDMNESLSILGILTTKAKERQKASKRIEGLVKDISDAFQTKPFETKIRESVKCKEALTEYGVPLHIYSPKSSTCIDYHDFTTELLEVLNGKV